MMDAKVIADPHSKYGSGKKATRHFITQRVTGALNILFTGFLIWLVLRLAGAERAEMVAVVANPFVAITLALLIVNVATHMRIGMREVVEDYVHEPRTNRLSLMLSTMFSLGIVIIALIAIAKIVFWG
jgi:succinate dehydrogenase / fumarate reductase membrane anchor subunit